MAISEESVLSGVKIGLGTLSTFLPPPWNLIPQILGELVDPVTEAVKGGGQPQDIVAAVKATLVATSNADMKAELGPDT